MLTLESGYCSDQSRSEEAELQILSLKTTGVAKVDVQSTLSTRGGIASFHP